MSMKDLVRYVTDDMQKWIDDLTFNDAWLRSKSILMNTLQILFKKLSKSVTVKI